MRNPQQILCRRSWPTADEPTRRSRVSTGAGVLLTLVWLVASNFAVPATLQAGQETILREQDIVLVVDSRWPGSSYGGYFPLRIRLSNMAQPRDLTLVFDNRDGGRGDKIPEVRRTVRIEQQATINLTLSVPVVSQGTSGELRVYDSSQGELAGLTSRHDIPGFGGAPSRTSLLVISSTNLDDAALQPFEDAAATESAYLAGVASGSSSPSHFSRSGYSNTIAEKDHFVVQPAQNLPVNWIDYSGVDLVAVAWPDWTGKLSTAEREALLKWTATGGVLMIFGTEKPATKLDELNRSLQLTATEAAGWINCTPESHQEVAIVTSAELRTGTILRGGRSPTVRMGMGGRPVIEEPKFAGSTNAAGNAAAWKLNSDTFSYRDWSLGRIYVFPQNPFPGTASDWAWWLSAVPKNMTQWPRKNGMTTRDGSPEFLNFLIPGIGTVPVFPFLTLITLFTLVIGPLNYYWLHKRRRLAAMVFTVPLIAGVTCALLFSYSLVADGFSIRSRINSFTWLDQQRKSAVSASRLCLYAPFAPSAGLKFSPECAVFPIWRQGAEFENGSLNWSGNDQRLSSGWFRSQTWTQFQTLEYRDERGRLDFTPPSDPNATTLAVSNGLSWDLQYLAIDTTGSGQESWFAGENIPAGATAQLKRVTLSELNSHVSKLVEDQKWKLPPGVVHGDSSYPMLGMSGRYRGYGGYEPLQTNLTTSLLGRNLPYVGGVETVPQTELYDWRESRNAFLKQTHSGIRRAHFWAISKKNPGIQTGVKSSVDSDSLHVISGSF